MHKYNDTIFQKFIRAFFDAVDDISEFMREQYQDRKKDYANHQEFCEGYCPIKDIKCRDCFKKEQEAMCEERLCGHCNKQNDCSDAFTPIGYDDREDAIPTDAQRNR